MKDKQVITQYIRVNMAPLGEERTNKEKVGTKVVKKEKGIFRPKTYEQEEDVYEERTKWVPSGKLSDIIVDMEGLSDEISNICNRFITNGYDVTQIIPINSGRYGYDTGWMQDGGYGYGYGYSVTDGVIIVGTSALSE